MREIVKIYRPRPTASISRVPYLLVNRDQSLRRFIREDEMPKSVLDALSADEKGLLERGYFEAEFSDPEGWKIGERVEDQEW